MRFRIETAALLIFSIGVYLLASTAWAETVRIDTRLQCMGCHAGPDRLVTDPETGEVRNVTIEMGDFNEGDHGNMHCLECHKEGFDQFPHVHLKTSTCMDCHPREEEGAEDDEPYDFDRILKEFKGTVHFTEYEHEKEKCCGTAPEDSASARQSNAYQGDKQRFTCMHCHSPHYFKATEHIENAQLILENDNEPCIRCHKDDATGALSDPAEPNLVAVHPWLPRLELHLRATRCIDCHTSTTEPVSHLLPVGSEAERHLLPVESEAERGCVVCHTRESVLLKRLYRYQVKQTPDRAGFINTVILQDAYVTGATRHVILDALTYFLLGGACLFVVVHGALRILRRHRAGTEGPAHKAEHAQHVPLWVRVWHWATALLFLVLAVTGVALHFATPDFMLVDFALATTWHDVAGILLAVSYGLYLIAMLATGYWRQYVPIRHGLRRQLNTQAVKYAATTIPTEQDPMATAAATQTRFTPLQQFIYLLVVFGLLPLLIVTGLLYLFPESAPVTILGLDGLWPAAFAHSALGMLATVYLMIHIYMGTFGRSDAAVALRLMVIGDAVPQERSGDSTASAAAP